LSVTGDIGQLHPTLLRRLNAMADGEGYDIWVQDGKRSYAQALEFYRLWKAGKGPIASLTSFHLGNPPDYIWALAADITAITKGGKTIGSARSVFPTHVARKYGLVDSVPSEGWHYQCVEGRNPPWSEPIQVVSILREGMRSEGVKKLQGDLNFVHTPSAPNLVTDGAFGPATMRAVKAYQSAKKLKADGVAGTDTLGSIEWAVIAELVKVNPFFAYPTLQLGAKDNGLTNVFPDLKHPVATLQNALNIACGFEGSNPNRIGADGKFGNGTHYLLGYYQGQEGLDKDHVAGRQVWSALGVDLKTKKRI
jgi:peptidoglycan hydrolase-like protein with peptidoglycan-binding domain